jgi:hypothetical protein
MLDVHIGICLIVPEGLFIEFGFLRNPEFVRILKLGWICINGTQTKEHVSPKTDS